MYPLNSLNDLIEWRDSPGRGRGVFARQDIQKGTVVESSPVIVLPDSEFLDGKTEDIKLHQHIFWWSDEVGKETALGWGYLALYNHSEKSPNVEMETGKRPETMDVRAIRDIRKGEELVFDYGDVWFTPVE